MPYRNKFIRWTKTSVWAFPAALLIILLALTLFKINGSSLGIYHDDLYGKNTHDSNLILNEPRSIRADEWLTSTQTIVAQSKEDFPKHNKTFPGGQDLSLISEVPIKEWPSFFKPQNWSFFVLPVDYAFALKWWLLICLLIVSCYFFTLRILPKQKTFAILFSLGVGLSPFELWWYQSGGFLTIAYGFLMAILMMRILNTEPIKFIKNKFATTGAYILALAFLMICFGLILYPPFQIAVALVLLFFFAGYILQLKLNEKIPWAALLHRLGIISASVVIAAIIGWLFIITHRAPIHAISNTLYPGHRVVESGGFALVNALDGFVMPLLQDDTRAAHFINNQSESSNFILLLPFLILPGLFLLAREWRKHRKIDWVFLSIQLCAATFLVRMFTPYGDSLFKLLLLDKVPHERLLIGLGFVGIIQIIYTIKKIQEAKIRKDSLAKIALVYGLGCFTALMLTGLFIRSHYPGFLHNFILIAVLAAFFAGIVGALLMNKKLLAGLLFLSFSLVSSFQILPIYRGLGELTKSNVVSRIEAVSNENDTWVTVGDDAYIYKNFAPLSNRPTIGGTQFYSNVDFWKATGDPDYEKVVNRQAHIVFSDSPSLSKPLTLVHQNSFVVKFDCSAFITEHIQFALSVHPLTQPCLQQLEEVKYPGETFYLYKISR